MSFNTVLQCLVMHLGNSNRKYAYFMNNRKLDKVTEEKDLGVVFTIT